MAWVIFAVFSPILVTLLVIAFSIWQESATERKKMELEIARLRARTDKR